MNEHEKPTSGSEQGRKKPLEVLAFKEQAIRKVEQVAIEAIKRIGHIAQAPVSGSIEKKTTLTEEEISRMIKALSNPKYKWRTVAGLHRETGISIPRIKRFLETGDGIVESSYLSTDGRRLFATRRNFEERASFLEVLVGALANRVNG